MFIVRKWLVRSEGGEGWEMVGPMKSPMELHSAKTKERVQFMQHNKQTRNKKTRARRYTIIVDQKKHLHYFGITNNAKRPIVAQE